MRSTSPSASTRVKPCMSRLLSWSARLRPWGTLSGASTMKRVPLEYCSIQATTSSAVCLRTSCPLTGEKVRPIRAYSSLRYSYISVAVPTVERGLRLVTFCSMAMAGGIPLM